MAPTIEVIRIGHRITRDIRVTTHCALTARALGAKGITLCGEEDKKIIDGVKKITEQWGGAFYITYVSSARQACSAAKRKGVKIVHATMYGLPLLSQAKKLRSQKKIAIVVGSQKVPGEIYRLADYNIAVTSQPHSEVAALAIIMHEIFKGKDLEKKFPKAKIKILPSATGKRVKKTL